jgi:hypothetical protein
MISSAEVLWDTYDGDGNTTGFAITTPVKDYDPNLVLVQVEDVTGSITTAEIGVGVYAYTIDEVLKEVQFTDPPVTGETVYIIPDVPITQLKDFVNGEAMNADNIEAGYDKLTLIVQQIYRLAQNHIGLALPEDGVVMGLPGPDLRALRVVGCDADGNFTMMDSIPSTTLVSAWMADNLLDDTSAAAARATLETYSSTEVDTEIGTAIDDLAGTGRTTETVKANADAITILNSDNRPFPSGYIYGLEVAPAADVDHDVTIATGKCRSYQDTYNMVRSTVLTKQIDATWAAGHNAGGLFAGSVASNTSYHLFLIRKDLDGSIDAGWDVSVSCVNIPSGYTAYRRIRSYLTDSSANIIQTVQKGDEFVMYRRKYDLDLRSGSPGWSGATNNVITLSVPTGLSVMAKITANYMDSAVGYVELRSPSCVAQSETLAYTAAGSIFVRDSGLNNSVEMQILTNTSGQIYANTNDTTPINFTVATIGWNDTRGRFGEV